MNGVLVIDKPAGPTSFEVVQRVRSLLQVKKAGHTGTLDPMATGVLVVGVERATRLLGHLTRHAKSYDATVVLGAVTTTHDAEGEVVAVTDASAVSAAAVDAALAALTGTIEQVPPAVSAIKVGGVRSYARARRGEGVVLAARTVTVSALERRGPVTAGRFDLSVTCSSGTYVRALARDLGEALGVGAHLGALRRTASGHYRIEDAHPLETLDVATALVPLADAAAAAFPRRDVSGAEADRLAHGVPLPPSGSTGPVAVLAPDGSLVALVEDRDGSARPLCVFVG